MAARIRTKLDKLWKKVVDPNMPLEDDKTVPGDFLKEHNIHLISHEFQISSPTEANLSLNPPLLFKHRPRSDLVAHPINPDGYDSYDIIGSAELNFREFKPPCQYRKHPSVSLESSDVLDVGIWLPHGVLNLRQLWGINPVNAPHPKLPDISGFEGGSTVYNRWDTEVYEYDMEGKRDLQSSHPHTILVSTQSSNGKDQTIFQGELAAIVTAMRNRSRQPMVWKYEDSDDDDIQLKPKRTDEVVELALRFRNEKRFPVLMVSLVGPQHARIYYACMAGQDLVIPPVSSEEPRKKIHDTLDYLSCILLSSPLQENSSAGK
ncbi:hypothetical protein BDW62DRAFT_199557 [Aspergillus aurantiobrunneus]